MLPFRCAHALDAFLRKHFGLSRFVAQPNKFVVFDAFFES